jgi:hypothetical protein
LANCGYRYAYTHARTTIRAIRADDRDDCCCGRLVD